MLLLGKYKLLIYMYIYMQSRIVFNKKNEEKKIVSRIECKYLLSKNKQSLKNVGMVPVRI